MIKEILLVGAGSFAGGAARYLVSHFMLPVSNGFPWGTFTVNVLGCLLIGALWGWSSRCPHLSPALSLVLSVGFCGGFITFSTFSKENLTLLQSGNYISFILYAFGSIALGLIAVMLGVTITK